MLVRIPIPATGGYANLGDGVILLCAFMMHPLWAAAAAGIGSMLADLLAGYSSYALGTLVIKAGVAFIAGVIFLHFAKGKSKKSELLIMIAAGIVAEAFMVAGYFVYEALFLGIGMGATGAILGNVGQGVVGVIVACITSPVLRSIDELKTMMYRK